MNDEYQVWGLCWYQPEQWARLLEISDDSDKLGRKHRVSSDPKILMLD